MQKHFSLMVVAFCWLSVVPSVAAEPKSTAEACDIGKACFDTGDYDSAIAAFNEAIRLDPKNAESYCRRGWAYTRKHDLDKALADCNEAIRLNPNFVLAHQHSGMDLWGDGQPGKSD